MISSNDLFTVAEAGDAAGVGNSNDLVIDMYFVQTSAGFAPQSVNIANGLAFVSGNGITIHIGDNLPTFQDGRDVVAQVAAHEIAHNLGQAILRSRTIRWPATIKSISHNALQFSTARTLPRFNVGVG